MIFIDTSAWYAASSSRDTNHSAAREFFAALQEPFITTDFVVDETLTLFRVRRENRHALEFGAAVIDARFAEIVEVESEDFGRAWQMFRDYRDKEWSFTDCKVLLSWSDLGSAGRLRLTITSGSGVRRRCCLNDGSAAIDPPGIRY